MGDKTGISWTDSTWNPIRGCSRTIAAGAKQSGCGDGTGGGCYAEAMAGRFCGPGQPYEGLVRITPKGARWTGVVRMVPARLADPLRWRKPRRIFVNSMSDLFHEALTNEQIASVFGVMAAAPRHTFQVLTKRAERMRDWFRWVEKEAVLDGNAGAWCINHLDDEHQDLLGDRVFLGVPWPLPNVWLGVSVENQAAADERIPLLLETPAALRFLSCEPLLGPVDLHAKDDGMHHWLPDFGPPYTSDPEDDWNVEPVCQAHGIRRCWQGCNFIDWVIAGAESGRGARPARVDWYRQLRDQCTAAGVPFHLKQATDVDSAIQPVGGISPKRADRVVSLPYLDGVQHAAIPRSPCR